MGQIVRCEKKRVSEAEREREREDQRQRGTEDNNIATVEGEQA